MIISLIVATDEEGGIAKKNKLPWYLPSDLKRFRAITMGHHLVMGRRTFETISKPLPGRVMIILTHRKDYHPDGCLVVDSLESAILLAENNHETELFIIGGGEIFAQSIDLADKIYLTTVHAKINADIFFPSFKESEWKLSSKADTLKDEKDEYASDFMILIRNQEKQG